MVSFSMPSEEKQPVTCSRRGLLVQVMKFMLKALPLRQRMAFRNGRVRIIGPFDKAKVGGCLMRLPLAKCEYKGHRESGSYRLAYIVKCQWICLRIILQKVAGEGLVFEERRRGDGKLRPGTGGFSHHDQESHYHGQEQESRSEIKSAREVESQGVYCTSTYMTVTILGRHGRGRRRLPFLKGVDMKTACHQIHSSADWPLGEPKAPH